MPDFKNLALLDRPANHKYSYMSTTKNKLQKLLPEHTFHIYNRGINGQLVFFQEKNYPFFLKKYASYTKDYLDTYAYCLLPNHFHILANVHSVNTIITAASANYKTLPKALQKEIVSKELCQRKDLPDFQNLADLSNYSNLTFKQNLLREFIATWLVSNQFRKFFGSYAKAINKQEDRNGSLFQKPFKRKLVDSKEYLEWLIWYLHRNPIHHKMTLDYKNYSHSSYQSLFSNMPTLLKRQEVLDAFGGKNKFEVFHEQAASDWDDLGKYTLE